MRHITPNAIRQLRTLTNMTQAELAARLGYSRTTIARWERQAPKDLSTENHLTMFAERCKLEPVIKDGVTVSYKRLAH